MEYPNIFTRKLIKQAIDRCSGLNGIDIEELRDIKDKDALSNKAVQLRSKFLNNVVYCGARSNNDIIKVVEYLGQFMEKDDIDSNT